MRRISILIATSLVLAGCNKYSAEEAARTGLKDPDSAKFGSFYYNSKTKRGCLTVNAKNEFGGYTGDQQAYVTDAGSVWEQHGITPTDLDGCKELWADQEATNDATGGQSQ